MLVLNKSNESNEIIVTISEYGITANSYKLEIHSPFTNKNYSINLGSNQSQYTQRYDLFYVDRTVIIDMEDGDYSYKIFPELPDNRLLETGYLKIISGNEDEQFLWIEEPEEDDDFIVYNQ